MEGLYNATDVQYEDSVSPYIARFCRESVNSNLVELKHLPQNYRDEIDKGISSGWKCLDEILQGIRPGEVTVITADTGVGKTTFCSQLLFNCAMQKVPVWLNSWEMRPQTIMRKLASFILRKPIKLQNFSEEDSEKFDEFTDQHLIYINPNTIGTTIDSFSKDIAKAAELGVKVVMIDHLDYLVNFRKEKVHEAIDDTVKRLHELAFAFSMHFLLICHPRQTSASNEEIGIHSLKGSSSIKQYADNVIVLHRCARTDPQSHPGKTKIKIAKNRMFGIEGTTYLFYQPLYDCYLEFRDF